MDTTSGLVSAYQIVAHSGQRVAERNLSVTNAAEVSVVLVPIERLEELRGKEILKIRVAPEHDQLAFTILVKKTIMTVLPGRILSISRESLKLLDEAGVNYEVVE
jgi:hypothetical protein